MNAQIFPSDELCMEGRELRRLRIAAEMSQTELAQRMGWQHKHSIQRLECKHKFCLHKEIMGKLLAILEKSPAATSDTGTN